jgi:hypothetical protein
MNASWGSKNTVIYSAHRSTIHGTGRFVAAAGSFFREDSAGDYSQNRCALVGGCKHKSESRREMSISRLIMAARTLAQKCCLHNSHCLVFVTWDALTCSALSLFLSLSGFFLCVGSSTSPSSSIAQPPQPLAAKAAPLLSHCPIVPSLTSGSSSPPKIFYRWRCHQSSLPPTQTLYPNLNHVTAAQ